MRPGFSIITPSFRQLDWLELCAASIADQEGVTVEHVVQDAGTDRVADCGMGIAQFAGAKSVDPGAGERLSAERPGYRLRLICEEDRGMYDAVNRGLRRAEGEILAYLNCDEQYLPGALENVNRFFDDHPEVDVAFGHAVVVDGEGRFLCCRKAIRPGRYHTWVSGNLAILTCSTFFRRRVIDDDGLFFDAQLSAIGDGVWVTRLLQERIRTGILPQITSSFLDDGSNLMFSEKAVREQRDFIQSAPSWARALRPWILLHYRLRKWVQGAYRQAPFSYSIYTKANPRERTTFHVSKPTFRWIR